MLNVYLIQFDKVGIKDHKYRTCTEALVTWRNSTNLLVWFSLCYNTFYFSYHVNSEFLEGMHGVFMISVLTHTQHSGSSAAVGLLT